MKQLSMLLACGGCALSLAACNEPRVRPQDQPSRGDNAQLAAPMLRSTPLTPEKVPTASAAPLSQAAQAAQAPTPAATPAATPASTPAASTTGNAVAGPQGRVAEVLRYDPQDPLADLEQADELDRGTGAKSKLHTPPPARGCAQQGEARRIWSSPAVASVAALGNGFVVAGYDRHEKGERIFVLHIPEDGLPQPVATLPIAAPHPSARHAAPGLAADAAQGVALAFTDGARVLRLSRMQVGAAHGGGAIRELAQGVDTRFAPAVAFGKNGPLVAFTLGKTPMQSQLVRVDAQDKLLGTHDITPPAMGAAAPTFVVGSNPPVLLTADARSGMSPIARVKLDAEGKPGPAEIVAPVGMLSEPPQLAAAQTRFGAFAAYTGLGAASTSAVGLLQIAPKAGGPEALVKGIAYGALHVSAISGANSVVFAADAPKSAGKAPKHDIKLTRIDAQGTGPELLIAGPEGDASHAALARASGGEIAVVFSSGQGVYLAAVRCAE